MGKKKRNEGHVKHDVNSTQTCTVCCIEVKVGTGGHKNFEIHLSSKKHLMNAKAAEDASKLASRALKPTLISNFFTKQDISPSVSYQAPPAPQLLAPETSHSTPTSPSDSDAMDIEIISHPSQTNTFGISATHPLVTRLRALSSRLPEIVPIGQESEPFAAFSCDPRDSVVAGEDPWESVIDPSLNRVIGFGVTTREIADIIRRGAFGIDGFCRWIDICVTKLKTPPALLEGKLERVFDALKLLGADDDPEVVPEIIESSHPTGPHPSIKSPGATQHHETRAKSSIASNKTGQIEPRTRPVPDTKHIVRHCRGLHLDFGDGHTPAFSYPSQIHGARSVPWTTLYSGNELWIQSDTCENKISGPDKPAACSPCRNLLKHDIIRGIMERNEHGARENTPYQWLSHNQVSQLLHRKDEQINNLKLARLNLERSLLHRARSLMDFKRFLFAVARGDIPRLHSLVATAQKRGSSIHRILELVDLAVQQVYKPKGYSEIDFQRQFLFLKLGGRQTAELAHRTCGLPSRDATREHIQTKPLIVSAKMPSLLEMTENLKISFHMVKPANVAASNHASSRQPRGPGYQEMADELKVESRLRWDASRNIILGPCREHVKQYSVEFCTIDQPQALAEGICDKCLHFATEATVIAISHFSKDPHKYAAHPFVVSGSCKREDVHSQKALLHTAIAAANEVKVEGRLYCLSSDGDSRRRRATALLTLIQDLDPCSELHEVLGELTFFNYLCGDEEITANIDTLHLMKRMRNTCIRAKGTTIGGVLITPQVLKRHLSTLPEATSLTHHRIEKLLSPNDKQDVKLAYDLLSAIASLPPATDSDIPTVQTTRRSLHLLGCIHAHVLETFTNVNLSLHEQLVHLSAISHLYLAIYSIEKGNFVPSQLFFDVQTWIKNAFFCVAKTKLDDPDGQFWLILLGTDSLEHLFGVVRTMISTDANADLLQLGNRLEAAATCCRILAEHPEWVRGPRRLSIRNWRDDAGDTSTKFDHINPASWLGNVHVKDVVLLTSWTSGRRLAEQELRAADFPIPFTEMEKSGKVDMLCPFGDGKVVLIHGLSEGEREEEEDEQDVIVLASNVPIQSVTTQENTGVHQHCDEIEDAATELLHQGQTPRSESYSPYVEIDSGGKSIRQHKSTICRILSEPHAALESTDRLKRVRGYSRYQEVKKDIPLGSTDESQTNAVLRTQDPAAFLVRSKDLVWLAIGEIVTIRQQSVAVDVLPAQLLTEPNVRLTAQIMQLACLSGNDEGDWEWTGQYKRSSCDLKGHSIQLLDPTVIRSTRPGRDQMPTYCFQSSELITIAAVLYGNMRSEIDTLPCVPWCEIFPYRMLNGAVCFICEGEGNIRGEIQDQHRCPRCPSLRLSKSSPTELVSHMGMHILHDNAMKNVDNPCGFCLSPGSLCSVRLKKGQGRKVGMQIDIQNSRCQHNNQVKLSLNSFAKSSDASPCTNTPIMCPLCPAASDAVWKYNLEAHIRNAHPTANLSEYTSLYEISKSELVALKQAFLSKPRWTAKRIRDLGNINVSEAHSSRVALRVNHMDGGRREPNNKQETHHISRETRTRVRAQRHPSQRTKNSSILGSDDSNHEDVSTDQVFSGRNGDVDSISDSPCGIDLQRVPTPPGQLNALPMPESSTPNRRRSKRVRINI